jgi:hypothetical protein
MFDAYCPTHGKVVLLGHGNIDRLENTDAGILLHAHCWCGEPITITTGKAASRRFRADVAQLTAA